MKTTLNFTIIFSIITFLNVNFLLSQAWQEVDTSLGNVVDITYQDGTLFSISNIGIFAFSNDNGNSWETKDIREIASLPNAIFTTITFFDSNFGLLGIRDQQLGNQQLRTIDGGENWEVMTTNFDFSCSTSFIPIDYININDTTALMSLHLSGTYFITEDRGSNWSCYEPFSSPDWLQIKEIVSESEWIFNGSDGLYKTENAGDNWDLIFDQQFAHFQITDNDEIYGLSWFYEEQNGIPTMYKSDDEFETFETISLNQFEDENIDLFVVVSPTELYLRLNGEEIYYSNDDGQSFEQIQVLSNVPFRTQKINGSWYMFGRGLWRLDGNMVSTKDILRSENIIVFPNPTSDFINIKKNEYNSYEILDQNGKIIQSDQIEKDQIDISIYQKGIYYLKLINGNKFLYKKIVKL